MPNLNNICENTAHKNAFTDIPGVFIDFFENHSYRHDTCASFVKQIDDERLIHIWIDYLDVDEREDENPNRFNVCALEGTVEDGVYELGDGEALYCGNSLKGVSDGVSEYIDLPDEVIAACVDWEANQPPFGSKTKMRLYQRIDLNVKDKGSKSDNAIQSHCILYKS